MLLLLSADFFFKIIFFSKNSFRNTIRVSNSLDSDCDLCSVCPDLGPNCLQRLSADDKSPLARKELKDEFLKWILPVDYLDFSSYMQLSVNNSCLQRVSSEFVVANTLAKWKSWNQMKLTLAKVLAKKVSVFLIWPISKE